MSKKYTAAQMKSLLMEVLSNAIWNMDALHNELRPYSGKPLDQLEPEQLEKMKKFSLILTIINDIIHPAHKFCYSAFKGNEALLDVYVANQKIAFEKNLVNPCNCSSCQETQK